MPDRRKPPGDSGSRPGSRPDGAPLPSDSGGFSIETTTMRLKSLRLRRAEVANKSVDEAVKAAIHNDSDETPAADLRAACVTTSVAWRSGTGPWPRANSQR